MSRLFPAIAILAALRYPLADQVGVPLTGASGARAEPGAQARQEPSSTEEARRLNALVVEALARSPAIAAARAEVAARREMESPAGAPPDPMLEAMLQNAGLSPTIGKEEMSMIGVEARVGLPYPGKRSAARAVAAAETSVAAAKLLVLERQVAAEVATQVARIYAIDRERETLLAATELVALLGEIGRSRYQSGEGDQEGLLKTQIEALRIAERLSDLANERLGMVAELNRWLDRPGTTPFGSTESLPETPVIPADAEPRAAEGSADVTRAAAAVVAAERRVDVARLDLKPNFSAGAGLASRGSLDPVVLMNVGIELPFWRRHKQLPLLRAAEQELEAARGELADAKAMARAEAARLQSSWKNADEQVRRYREGIVPQTSATLDAARAAYLAGRGNFSTVIEDFNLWLEARVALARRETDRFIARVGFDRLTGNEE